MNRFIQTIIYLACILFGLSLSASNLDTVPSTSNFGLVSDTWNDMDFANPTEGIPLISLPNGISTGNASLSFPIDIPEGRLGMQPQLSIDYDSEGGQTWLGTGWDLSISSISLDTRWGVPRFLADTESEIYLLDGEQMGPVFHREVQYVREADRTFILRQNLNFQQIIRHGNSPNNYWWEVTDKDGTTHSYGGRTSTGVSINHVLQSPDGIVEWYLFETREPNGNYIQYEYQLINGLKGKEMYPLSINYTGHNQTSGNYFVQFNIRSTPRTDISISGRYGFLRSQESLLENIVIRYTNQQIRSYQFYFEEGAFGKTLLQSIEALDRKNEPFYKYEFDYHNEILQNGNINAFGEDQSWTVAKDNLDIGSIVGNVDGFNGKPTILGSANSNSQGANTAITIGFVAPPNTKDFTVGPNGGIVNNTSKGITALVDMNGDGLPDKVWREESAIYYRPNLFRENGTPSFGDKHKLDGITSFNTSNTFAWNIGAELNVPPVYAGYTHEEATTRTTSYLIDFNGDELIDIVQNGDVYFNHLENGHPTFTKLPTDTPSPIYLGEAIDPSTQTFDVSQLAQLQKQSPLHDVIRVWIAPKSGLIDIQAPVQLLEDSSPESQNYLTKDGARVSIQLNGIEYYEVNISPDDYSIKNPIVGPLLVSKGDELYFRVGSIDDGSFDQVLWDPTITYVGSPFSLEHPDNYDNNIYRASEDFLLSENKPLAMVADGEIQISFYLLKPALSDSITIGFSGAADYFWTLTPELILDTSLVVGTFPVSAGEQLSFSISSESNVDWPAVSWSPRVEYVSFDDGSPAVSSSGEALISDCPSIEIQGYFHSNEWEEIVAVDSGQVNLYIEADPSFFGTGSKKVVVKHKNNPELIEYFEMITPVLDVSINTTSNDSLFIGVYYEDVANNMNVVIDSASITYMGIAQEVRCGIYEKGKRNQGLYGHLYRGWGQFIYNANDGRSEDPIQFLDLDIDTTTAAQDTSLVDENSGSTDIEGAGGNEELIIVMTSDPKLLAWRGSDASAFVSRDKQSASRRSQKYIGPPIAQTSDQFTGPALVTRFVSDGGFGGLGVPGTPVAASGGYTKGTTWSELDLADFNGDRYPDIIGMSTIQFTNMRGGLSNDIIENNWEIHEAFSEATSIGLGLNPGSTSAKNAGESMGVGSNKSTTRVRQKTRGNSGKARSSFESATEAIGISGNVAFDKDSTSHTFLDMNGDALEDKVWQNGDVAINLGYSFAERESWNFSSIRAGDATDTGGGLGINISNGSYLAGISVTKTINSSHKGFVDLNGDALPDMITSVDPLMVQFNTGSSFTDPVQWIDIEAFDEGQAIGESANVGFSIPIVFFFIKIVINIQGFLGQGSATSYDAFMDINGDGFPDYLRAADDDANLTANYSTIGRTNLLKEVLYPLGATLTLDYQAFGNSENMPFSKWVLTEAIINDGVAGDGSDFQERHFKYENGFYDRHERQFLGFQKVEQSDMNGDIEVRLLSQEFYVDNYYQKGLLKSAELFDQKGRLHKRIEQQYALRDVETEAILPVNAKFRDDLVAFPMLTSKLIRNTEGSDELFTQQNFNFSYDLVGNVLQKKETDQYGFNKTHELSYQYDQERYIVDRLEAESILENSITLRKTEYTYDSNGNQTSISQAMSDLESATTDVIYDNYGLVAQIVRPSNIEGERLSYEFEYDSFDHQFQVQESDNYGYSKTFEYEPLFGSLQRYTDENNLTWTYRVDDKGRPWQELSPRGLSLDHSYTKEYEYYEDAETAYAICRHKNSGNMPDIETFQFSDGVHRLIQYKYPRIVTKGSKSDEVLVVSGTSVFDSLGRTVEQYREITESLGSATVLNTGASPISPIKFQYDLNDRVITQQSIDSGIYVYRYNITNFEGANYLQKTIINPLGLRTELVHDQRGILRAKKESDALQEYLWVYKYDAMDQLLEIRHPNESLSSYEYDLLGRRISILTPESGKTSLKYDPASNLIEKVTATIRENLSQNASIRYKYDKERLLSINYPKNFQNKVQIHYGSSDAKFNRARRIYLIEDATGGKEFFYDEFGNPSKTIQTVLVNRSKIFSYVSASTYDLLNRITTLSYPDGEELTYQYDNTGQLQSLSGLKAGTQYHYISNIEYDHFGNKTRIDYGNSVIANQSFDDKGLLHTQELENSYTKLLNLSYSYNKMDKLLLERNLGVPSSGIGAYTIEKNYDTYSRIDAVDGNWISSDETSTFSSNFDYATKSQLSMKFQEHEINGEQVTLTTRFLDYQYDNQDVPLRPSEVAGREHTYDENGNLLLVRSEVFFDFDQYIYDEENRLIGSSNNGKINLYSYDAFGRRVLKSEGGYQGIFINGAPAGWLEHKDNYQIDLNPYFTVYEHDFRKHIYAGGERICTKIGTGVFQSTIGVGAAITAGSLDYKSRIVQLEQQIIEYYASLGLPPGPPTLLAYYAQPEFNRIGFGDVNTGNPYSLQPSNWPNISPPDTMGPPGPPIFFDLENLSNETVLPGYNFVSGQITKELQQFFYHYDASENVNLVTANNGEIRQFSLYFPGGEKWIDRSLSMDQVNFAYQGLEFDIQSGLYNFGESYYNPITNLSLSLDKYEQTFGSQALESFGDGQLFYDFAQIDESIDFDPEIINSERPSAINSGQASIINIKDPRENEEGGKDEDSKTGRRKLQVHPDVHPDRAEMIADLIEALELADLQDKGGFDSSQKTAYRKIRTQAKQSRTKKNILKKRKKNNKRTVRFRVN